MRAAQSFVVVVVDGVVDVVAFSFNFICFVIIIQQKQFRQYQVKTFLKARRQNYHLKYVQLNFLISFGRTTNQI